MPALRPFAPPPPGSGLRPVLGRGGLPVLGRTLEYMRDPMGTSRQQYEEFGPVSWTHAYGIPIVVVIGPEAIGEVLVNRDKAYANGPGWSYFIGPFFERGLMLLDFEEHLHHRRIMQQAFTRDRLVGYLKGINAAFGDGYSSWEPQRGFRFHTAFKQLTLDLATTVFVGHHLGAEADDLNAAFFDAIQAGTSVVRFPVPGGRWHKGLQGRAVLEAFIRGELPTKRASTGDDLFSALCHAEDEDGNRFTDDDVVNHMIFLLMAAHDTSTTTMTTLVNHVAADQDLQDQLRAESQALGTDHLEYDDLAALPTLALAIKEAQRIVTPVPSLARKTVRDTALLGHHIPADTYVALYTHVTHHLEEYWPDPTRFDPYRFAEGRREDKAHPYAWVPFGGGVHKCIGMHFGNLEVTAAMHQLLLNFRWSVPEGYEMPIDWTSLPYPSDGLPITLERI